MCKMLVPKRLAKPAIAHLLPAGRSGRERSLHISPAGVTDCPQFKYGVTRRPRHAILPCGRVGEWRIVQSWLEDKCGGSSLHSACGHLRWPGEGLVCTCSLTKRIVFLVSGRFISFAVPPNSPSSMA